MALRSYSFIRFAVWQATMAAVSVRRRLVPSPTGINPFLRASSISFSEKSPSGPIRIRFDALSFISFLTAFYSGHSSGQ
jgi:hypothetical protein